MASVAPHMRRYREYRPPRGSIGWLAPSGGKAGEGAGGDSTEDANSSSAGAIYFPPLKTGSDRHYRKKD